MTTDESAKQIETRAVYVCVCLLLVPLLSVIYAELVFPTNEYLGFRLDPDPIRIVEATLAVILTAALSPLDVRRPAAFMAQFFVIAAFVPMAVYFAMTSQPRAPMYAMLCGVLACVSVTRSELRLRIPAPARARRVAPFVGAAVIAAVLAVMYASNGAPVIQFDLYAVYDLRREASASGRHGYFITWAAEAINPFLMAYCISKRRPSGFALGVAAQVVIFLYTGLKSSLFHPLLIGLVWIVYRMPRPHLWLPWGLALASVALLLVNLIDPFFADVVSDFSFRRVLFVPAFLNFGYFDFFGSHPKVFLTSSFLDHFAQYPYGATSTGELIGNHMGLGAGNATNGFLATGFMHFGAVGVVLFGFVAGGLMKVLDCFAGRMPTWLLVSTAIGPYRAFMTEADIPTSLVTHGVLVALVLIWLISAPEHNRPQGSAAVREAPPRLASA
jgi:hypothetical protein